MTIESVDNNQRGQEVEPQIKDTPAGKRYGKAEQAFQEGELTEEKRQELSEAYKEYVKERSL